MDAILGMLQRMTPPAKAAVDEPSQQAASSASADSMTPEEPVTTQESEAESSSAPQVCENAHNEEDCEAWAQEGECTSNPAFMEVITSLPADLAAMIHCIIIVIAGKLQQEL